ncbi:thioredoxin family protein [Marinicrinis lubricantis]|uniref:Thioredoxin family protein n=1 Tax=Marinicrinis lubricantis TaxID=2086470 RepID=A0ABW1IJH1_9BACL
MAKDLSQYIRKGLKLEQFMKQMTKNQEAFRDGYEKFAWPSDDDREFYDSLKFRDDLRCLILAADWCGDVVRNVPVVFKLMEAAEIETEVLIMEEHLEVMDQFLTMGGRSIPVVIFVDTGGYVLGQWGPRPAHVQEPMVRFKQNNPDRSAADYEDNLKQTREEIKKRYGEGTGYQALIVTEIRELLSSF